MKQKTLGKKNESVPKLATGIMGLDEITRGGIPKGRSTLVVGTSGSCKTITVIQYLVNGIELTNEGAVFVTFEETPEEIRRNVRSFGWDIEKYEKENKWAFVDVSPEPHQIQAMAGDYDFSALMARIENAIKKVKAKRVVIDSISAIFSQFHDSSIVRRELFRVAEGLKALGVTALITAERTVEYGEIARYGVEEFVTDNVIILRNNIEDEKRRRTIEVLKLRGVPHHTGEYPFTISNAGIEVMPLTSMKMTMESSAKRISSGNRELDKMCGGGFFRDSIILASGATGTGKTLLVTTFLSEGCKNGEKTLVFAFEESRSQLLRNAQGWGLDFTKWEKKGLLKIFCKYPEVASLPDHLLAMEEEIARFKPTRVALDSLSALERISTGKSFREFVIGLTSHLKHNEIAGLITAVPPALMGGGASVAEEHISSMTDSIIIMRYVELMGTMRRGLTVLKMRGSLHDKSIREYTVDDKGLHIGKAFHNVGGIIAGTPTHIGVHESERLEGMFGE